MGGFHSAEKAVIKEADEFAKILTINVTKAPSADLTGHYTAQYDGNNPVWKSPKRASMKYDDEHLQWVWRSPSNKIVAKSDLISVRPPIAPWFWKTCDGKRTTTNAYASAGEEKEGKEGKEAWMGFQFQSERQNLKEKIDRIHQAIDNAKPKLRDSNSYIRRARITANLLQMQLSEEKECRKRLVTATSRLMQADVNVTSIFDREQMIRDLDLRIREAKESGTFIGSDEMKAAVFAKIEHAIHLVEAGIKEGKGREHFFSSEPRLGLEADGIYAEAGPLENITQSGILDQETLKSLCKYLQKVGEAPGNPMFPDRKKIKNALIHHLKRRLYLPKSHPDGRFGSVGGEALSLFLKKQRVHVSTEGSKTKLSSRPLVEAIQRFLSRAVSQRYLDFFSEDTLFNLELYLIRRGEHSGPIRGKFDDKLMRSLMKVFHRDGFCNKERPIDTIKASNLREDGRESTSFGRMVNFTQAKSAGFRVFSLCPELVRDLHKFFDTGTKFGHCLNSSFNALAILEGALAQAKWVGIAGSSAANRARETRRSMAKASLEWLAEVWEAIGAELNIEFQEPEIMEEDSKHEFATGDMITGGTVVYNHMPAITKALQIFLAGNGHNITQDGVWRKESEEALRKFLSKKGLLKELISRRFKKTPKNDHYKVITHAENTIEFAQSALDGKAVDVMDAAKYAVSEAVKIVWRKLRGQDSVVSKGGGFQRIGLLLGIDYKTMLMVDDLMSLGRRIDQTMPGWGPRMFGCHPPIGFKEKNDEMKRLIDVLDARNTLRYKTQLDMVVQKTEHLGQLRKLTAEAIVKKPDEESDLVIALKDAQERQSRCFKRALLVISDALRAAPITRVHRLFLHLYIWIDAAKECPLAYIMTGTKEYDIAKSVWAKSGEIALRAVGSVTAKESSSEVIKKVIEMAEEAVKAEEGKESGRRAKFNELKPQAERMLEIAKIGPHYLQEEGEERVSDAIVRKMCRPGCDKIEIHRERYMADPTNSLRAVCMVCRGGLLEVEEKREKQSKGEDEKVVELNGLDSKESKGVCYMCSGTGKTKDWKNIYFPPFEQKRPSCCICWDDADYGISPMCDHYFCSGCVQSSLKAMLDVGQFPAYCPACRAEAQPPGSQPVKGEIISPALSFLMHRGCISNDVRFRVSKENRRKKKKSLGRIKKMFFACPGDCGRYLKHENPDFRLQIVEGKDGHMTKHLPRPGICPCGQMVCMLCHAKLSLESVQKHDCQSNTEETVDKATLRMLKKTTKKCPNCGRHIEKNQGCKVMMCGTKAHGSLETAVKNGGCGLQFNWDTLKPVSGGYIDIGGKRVSGYITKEKRLAALRYVQGLG